MSAIYINHQHLRGFYTKENYCVMCEHSPWLHNQLLASVNLKGTCTCRSALMTQFSVEFISSGNGSVHSTETRYIQWKDVGRLSYYGALAGKKHKTTLHATAVCAYTKSLEEKCFRKTFPYLVCVVFEGFLNWPPNRTSFRIYSLLLTSNTLSCCRHLHVQAPSGANPWLFEWFNVSMAFLCGSNKWVG